MIGKHRRQSCSYFITGALHSVNEHRLYEIYNLTVFVITVPCVMDFLTTENSDYFFCFKRF